MIQDAIGMVVAGESLSSDQAAQVMEQIMSGEATPAQFGAFVTALRIKGETVDEITGMAQVMRDRSLHVTVDGTLVDTCGTGGGRLAELQHFDDRRFCGRRRRGQGRQAREPGDVGIDRLG